MDNVDRIAQAALKGSKIDLGELGNVYAIVKECLQRGFDDDRSIDVTAAYVKTVARK